MRFAEPLEQLEMVPEHLRGGVERYVREGIQPGHFLCAVIDNDLFEAVRRGGPESLAGLKSLVSWFDMFAPAPCYGSLEKRLDWQKRRSADVAK